MARPGGFSVDVPVTLTVAVRGERLTRKQAFAIATKFANDLQPAEAFIDGYNSVQDAGAPFITEVSLDCPSDESCEVLDELEPEEESE